MRSMKAERVKVIPLPQSLMAGPPTAPSRRASLIGRGASGPRGPGIRRQVIVAVLAALLALSGLALTALIWRDPQLHLSMAILSGLLSIELLAVPWLCRSPRHLDLAGALTIGGLAGFLSLLAFMAGGLDQPMLSLLIAMPVIATVLLSPRAGVSVTLSLCAVISLMLLLELRGLAPRLWPLAPFESSLLRGAVLLLATTSAAVAIWAAESRWRRARERWNLHGRPDPISGLLTAWQFDQGLRSALSQPVLPGSRATLFLLDVDGFSAFQQRHGRGEADELLRRVGAAIRASATDPQALVARLEADRFALFCWCASRVAVRTLYERMQLLSAATTADLPATGGAGVTLSIGIAERDPQAGLPPDTVDRLRREAGEALLAARAIGGNKVRLRPDAA